MASEMKNPSGGIDLEHSSRFLWLEGPLRASKGFSLGNPGGEGP